ncbi:MULTISPECIES: LuxR family transcriptional regulator [unclassified Crossiella]|uniref:ATP-binding protein n=1 Tax=unclassified Crossiella TaxID=2620835 RepID=UPI0020003DCA|nr:MULTISPECIES: LuxR family transcriptional regulator [unclassified Crossiella]MCK2238373.1 AAA family ATPase [Crossiella sp. S99.2]MCK2256413.1 AAA family ATPase [Crossiella sp. S99.1]
MDLVGRAVELNAVDELLSLAHAGHGTSALLRGPAGAGKSALLRAVLARARAAGDLVLAAGADRWEADFPLCLLRQLFSERLLGQEIDRGRELTVVSAGGRAPGVPAAAVRSLGRHETRYLPYDAVDELYRVAVGLSEKRPLVIAIDDLHWADTASARWLAYLLRRIGGERVLVLGTTAPAEVWPADLADRFAHHIVLDGLSIPDVTTIAGALLGVPVAEGVGAACHAATAGNPFLVHALLRGLRQGGVPPTVSTVRALLERPPAEIVSWLRLVLAELGPGAAELAGTLAALGEEVELDLAGAIRGLSPERAARLADALTEAGLLNWRRDQVSLRQPLVRAAAAADLSQEARQHVHGGAARLLHARGAGAERVGAELLRAGPLGEAWAAQVLELAAAEAVTAGRTGHAVRYLRAALREQLGNRQRAGILVRLGSVLSHLDVAGAVAALRRALTVSTEPAQRAEIARQLAGLLCLSRRHEDGLRVLTEVREQCADPEVTEALLVGEALLALLHSSTAAARLTPEPGAELPPVLWSVRAILAGSERDRVLSWACAEADTALLSGPATALALSIAGANAAAAEETDRLFEAASSPADLAFALAVRTEVGYRLGRLTQCRDDARACLNALVRFGPRYAHGLAVTAATRLADTLSETGDVEGAHRLYEEILAADQLPGGLAGAWLLAGRGRLRIATGAPAEGVEDLLCAGRRLDAWRMPNPAVVPWRSAAAIGLATLGRLGTAKALAMEELELARSWGSPQAIGGALRVSGVLARGSAAVELLREAARVLAEAEAPLEHARALADLGTALRKTNQLAEARDQLRLAGALAQQCGATVVDRRIRAELRVSGARPRRQAHSGLEALTPTELRVANLAAHGLSNREIAARLFVVRRTVELHLSSAYRKLGITSRTELPPP